MGLYTDITLAPARQAGEEAKRVADTAADTAASAMIEAAAKSVQLEQYVEDDADATNRQKSKAESVAGIVGKIKKADTTVQTELVEMLKAVVAGVEAE